MKINKASASGYNAVDNKNLVRYISEYAAHQGRKREIMSNKRALTAYEDTNMYGGAHTTNYGVARKAAEQGRDLIVHSSHYDGQNYHYSTYRVTNLTIDSNTVTGERVDCDEPWIATTDLCEYARTGKI